jgi:hypothetical protein
MRGEQSELSVSTYGPTPRLWPWCASAKTNVPTGHHIMFTFLPVKHTSRHRFEQFRHRLRELPCVANVHFLGLLCGTLNPPCWNIFCGRWDLVDDLSETPNDSLKIGTMSSKQRASHHHSDIFCFCFVSYFLGVLGC